MLRRASQSQSSQSRPDADSYTHNKVIKARGVCSRCLAVRQLHLRDGSVHLRGPRNNPCPGSRLPPLASACSLASQEQGTELDSAPRLSEDVEFEGQWAQAPLAPDPPLAPGTKMMAEVFVAEEGSDVTGLAGHPRLRGNKVMKHIPRGARFVCSSTLVDILQMIIDNPDRSEAWGRLLHFASNILMQPRRAGRRRNMANTVKTRIENRDFLRTEDLEGQEIDYERGRASARDLFLAAVNAKLEEGNIRAASCILCSQDYPVKATNATFAEMQEKHPPDKWKSNMAHLPDASRTAPFQVSEKEVADAVRSFPAGSKGGQMGSDPNICSTC